MARGCPLLSTTLPSLRARRCCSSSRSSASPLLMRERTLVSSFSVRWISASFACTSRLSRWRSASSVSRCCCKGPRAWRRASALAWACFSSSAAPAWALRLLLSSCRLERSLACRPSSSNRPTLSCRLTSSISPRDNAEISPPVITVMTTAVRRGRRPRRLNRALPTRVPRRSPRVDSTPPRTSSVRMSSQPVNVLLRSRSL